MLTEKACRQISLFPRARLLCSCKRDLTRDKILCFDVSFLFIQSLNKIKSPSYPPNVFRFSPILLNGFVFTFHGVIDNSKSHRKQTQPSNTLVFINQPQSNEQDIINDVIKRHYSLVKEIMCVRTNHKTGSSAKGELSIDFD